MCKAVCKDITYIEPSEKLHARRVYIYMFLFDVVDNTRCNVTTSGLYRTGLG